MKKLFPNIICWIVDRKYLMVKVCLFIWKTFMLAISGYKIIKR